PATVKETRRAARFRSFAPNSSSSSAIWCETAGWDRLQRLAARAKCRSSATAAKVRSWRSSIRAVYQTDSIVSLDESEGIPYIRAVMMDALTARASSYAAGPLIGLLIVLQERAPSRR